MITFRGTVLVVTAVFTLLLARLTQVGWLYILDAILWGLILVSLALPWLTVMSVDVRRNLRRPWGGGRSPGPSEGEVVQLELWLKNCAAWPRHFLSASYDCPLSEPTERWQRFFLSRLDAGASLPLVSEVECHRRGMHELGPVT